MNKSVIISVIILGGLVLMTAGKKIISSAVEAMASAIMTFEDYVVPGGYSRSGEYMADGSRSYRNNNPGNLRWNNPDTIPWGGAMGLDPQNHVIFDSFESGWNALLYQLNLAFTGRSQVYSPSDTLLEFFSKYAEANSTEYAAYVAQALGVTPDTRLENITVAT